MKVNSTVALTLILLALMVGAGLISTAWGVALGREALKGITQPDTRPANNMAKRQGATARREQVSILREDDIINNVKARMSGNTNGAAKDPRTSLVPAPDKTTAKTAVATAASPAKLPLVSQSQDVVLELNSIRKQNESLILQVSLRNNGKQPVQVLYNFLSVVDERGRSLVADVEGLPSDLPSLSKTFTGTISISAALLDGVEKLSLTLTDYPDQRLQLQLPNIAITG